MIFHNCDNFPKKWGVFCFLFFVFCFVFCLFCFCFVFVFVFLFFLFVCFCFVLFCFVLFCFFGKVKLSCQPNMHATLAIATSVLFTVHYIHVPNLHLPIHANFRLKMFIWRKEGLTEESPLKHTIVNFTQHNLIKMSNILKQICHDTVVASHRQLCCIKSRVRDFLWKLLSFHTEIISYWNDFSQIHLGKCAS